ncbi:hypothetical protein [Streptomyces sp. MA15]|uniref:hypothetical protein n=1 Tax=Streptomyces sp. MA15 TaxID=3055061 RepID=UPI0025B05E99|nr:hypothetical protein [Streptomyces sp. MA15]MDN3271494.1 hypothetical protein [Streptomyces sp. MA15]
MTVTGSTPLDSGREIYAELHHDGTVVLAANLSWQALKNSFHTDHVPFGLLVHQGYLGACCRDVCLLTSQLARHLRLDSGLLLHATVAVGAPKTAPLIPVGTDSSGFPRGRNAQGEYAGPVHRPDEPVRPRPPTVSPTHTPHPIPPDEGKHAVLQETPVYDPLVAERGDTPARIRDEADHPHRPLAQLLRQAAARPSLAPTDVPGPQGPPAAP